MRQSRDEFIRLPGALSRDALPLSRHGTRPDNPEATNITEVKASLLRALAKGEPDTTAFVRYAVPVRTANGTTFEERYWSTVHTPVLDENGTPILVFQRNSSTASTGPASHGPPARWR